jgi:uncharacterized protein (DUF2252 family)
MAVSSPPAASTAHPSTEEREAHGRAARADVRRRAQGAFEPAPDRPDPVDVLEQQAASRVSELVPIRYGRMLVSPFTFYRGAAAIMAADLAASPNSGLRAQLCGDAHLSNFGGFASPDRELIFDINDFDETLPGPWEWDVKRLAASLAVGGRDRGFNGAERREIVLRTVGEYRAAMRRFAEMKNLEVWYARLDGAAIRSRWVSDKRDAKRLEKVARKATTKDSMRALSKLTHRVDGELRIINDPPLIVPFDELVPAAESERMDKELRTLFRAYGRTLQGGARELFETYRRVDVARKVVGVGSVGTRARIVLLLGRDDEDPLFLQAKEAGPSVLEPYAGKSRFANHGQRVVEGQWLMQAASDIFLGWIRATGIDGKQRDLYVRQLWDWKASADVDVMGPSNLADYAEMCGWTLARAHARSGDRVAIAAYLGSGDAFDRAMASFAETYADQNERDYAALESAVKSGRVAAEPGI